MKRILLVGGAPLTGKTTIARQKAEKYNNSGYISSDNIRELMLKFCKPSEYTKLFYGQNLTVQEFYDKFNSAAKVMNGEIAQGKDVEVGMLAFLNAYLHWETVIIEGIAVTPDFYQKVKDCFPKVDTQYEILLHRDDQEIVRRIKTRGLWDKAENYPDSYKVTEFEWVKLYNQWFKQKAQEHAVQALTPEIT